MLTVRIQHPVPDFDRWKQLFDADPADRRGSGVRRYRISRPVDDPKYVMIDLEFDDRGKAEAFVGVMREVWRGPAGSAVAINPEVRIVETVEGKDV